MASTSDASMARASKEASEDDLHHGHFAPEVKMMRKREHTEVPDSDVEEMTAKRLKTDDSMDEDESESEWGSGDLSKEEDDAMLEQMIKDLEDKEKTLLESSVALPKVGPEEDDMEISNKTSDSDSEDENEDATTVKRRRITNVRPAPADPNSLETLKGKQFKILLRILKDGLKATEGSILSTEKNEIFLRIAGILGDKYVRVVDYRPTSSRVNREFPKTKEELAVLLSGKEEDRHSWIKGAKRVPRMLLRVWDGSSQGQIRDKKYGFLAAKSTAEGELNTEEGRKLNIELHNNFSNRKPTCFISFSPSFEECWEKRVPHHRKRGEKKKPARPIKISLLNTAARKRRGWPILNMLEEIDAYGAKENASRDFVYAKEWIMLYQVHPSELVWTWWEKDVAKWLKKHRAGPAEWMEEVAIPAFEEHEKLSAAGAQQDDITKAIEALLKKSMPDALKRRL